MSGYLLDTNVLSEVIKKRPEPSVLARLREVLGRVRVLPSGEREALRAGDLLADLEAAGLPTGIEDVLIGATALVSSLAVATRNVRHFRRLPGLVVESWWPEEKRA